MPEQVDPNDLWARLRGGMQWEIPDNRQVRDARAYYLAQDRYFEAVTERGALYLHYIVEEIERRNMPMELALLPLVESTLNPFALSSQQAMGLWQIMPATGRTLGLSSDWWYDGRRDLRESTAAALDYLQYLHDSLEGDWLLAIAAYNGGVGRVGRAVLGNSARGRRTDFWSLPLPAETRKYVPRLLALSSLVGEPDAWELALPPLANAPAFVPVPTGGQIELARAAELAEVDLPVLQALNPGHLRWATSPGATELLLPPERADLFRQRLATLSPEQRVSWQHYRVKRGDTLSRIAQTFDSRVDLLRKANKIQGSLIREGSTLLIPQGAYARGALAQRGGPAQIETRDYKVRRGDSLYRIARRFKVKVTDLIAWNALNPQATIYPGQQLTMYVRGG
ncbi:LysM peptidoglycan-binding domain-containing protein [Haliea sp. E1-2-M8]|uniref:LysM peptidoglycan-binding domain-containing protein n=1 Tax=Haliea sp. E1-2-M8 TaxID=3064706 RepID=UPI0027211BA7|nr:LysM peptidoglycan-binding domain-containing protein [Haliea sp. E1-2-M8]MDO8862354.1 LysM peptidoglycan-binding domain-containing protein [Haliea sp. E1-2-M8]